MTNLSHSKSMEQLLRERAELYTELSKRTLVVRAITGQGSRKAGSEWHSLDGILAYAVASDITEGKPYLLTGERAVNVPLPLLEVEGLPICSDLTAHVEYSGVGWFLKRSRDGSQTRPTRGMPAKVDERGGPDQPRRVPVAMHLADVWEARCIGNKGEIMRLLQTITHIGARGDVGCGEVIRWEVKEWEGTVAQVLTQEGESGPYLARAVPVSAQQALKDFGILLRYEDAGLGGWRPPYWHMDNYAHRWAHRTPVTINKELASC